MGEKTCLRCTVCGISYPPRPEFQECPQCDGKTDPIKDPPTVDLDEATRLLREKEFRQWCEKEGRE